MDFKKAFDSVEHAFIFKVLRKFNFGDNFIKWISILYNNPIFKIKNNGWLSKDYFMRRGVRQGCAVSALIFIIVVEVLSIMIRSNNDIIGIHINDKEHKVIQYADDITVTVNNVESVLSGIFSKCAGPTLNVRKTKGIWLPKCIHNNLRKELYQ